MKLSLKLLFAEFACEYPGSLYSQTGPDVPLLSSSSIITPAFDPSPDVLYVHVPSIAKVSGLEGISVITSKRYADCFNNCNSIIVPNTTDLLKLPTFLASVFSRYFNWSDALYDAIARKRDLQALIDLTVPMVNQPMYFSDSSWKMIAQYSGDMEYVNPTWSYQKKYKYLPYSVYSDIIDANEMHLYRNEPHALYCKGNAGFPSFPFVSKAIRKGGKHYGNFFIIEFGRKLDARDFEIAEHLGNLVSTTLYGENEYLASSALYSSHFIIDVIEGALSSKSLIADQLHALGWNYVGDYGMSLITTADGDAALLNHIMFLANSISDNVTSFPYNGGVVSIYSTFANDSKHIRTQLSRLALDFNNIVALSNGFSSFNQVGSAYREISFLKNLADRRNLKGRLLDFSDYFIDYLCEQTSSMSMFEGKVDQLAKHDEMTGSDYCQTLYHWLLLERNTVKTANLLFIHRNTLKNRLRSIEELLELDLDKPDIRMQLIVSLHPLCRDSGIGGSHDSSTS